MGDKILKLKDRLKMSPEQILSIISEGYTIEEDNLKTLAYSTLDNKTRTVAVFETMTIGCKTVQGTIPSPPPPANIVVQSFDIGPSTGTIPFQAVASAVWVNNGGSTGTAPMAFIIDGVNYPVGNESQHTLAPGASVYLILPFTVNDTLVHTVCPIPNP